MSHKQPTVLSQELSQLAIPLKLHQRLYEEFGDDAVKRVQENPYEALSRIQGLRFSRIDAIAKAGGVEERSELRKVACLRHCMNINELKGHTAVPIDQFLVEARIILGYSITESDIPDTYIIQDGQISSKEVMQQEQRLAYGLLQLRAQPDAVVTPEILQYVEARMSKTRLTQHQQACIRYALTSPIVIGVGPARTGKSSTIPMLLTAFPQAVVLAPTYAGAHALQVTFDIPATTIADYVSSVQTMQSAPHAVYIADDFSFVDTAMASQLVSVMRKQSARLIIFGDKKHLRPSRMGSVFQDMIDSELFLLCPFEGPVGSSPDIQHIWKESEVDIVHEIMRQVSLHPSTQVLTVSRHHATGSTYLNYRLRNIVNPKGANIPRTHLCVGDRVLYDELYVIRKYDAQKDTIYMQKIEFGNQIRSVPLEQSDKIQLGYAIPVSMAHGMKFSRVILPIHESHEYSVNKNLIYSATATAVQRMLIIGHRETITAAYQRDQRHRITRLRHLLRVGASWQGAGA